MLKYGGLNLDFCNKIEQTPINRALSKVSKERKVEVPKEFKNPHKVSGKLDKHYSGGGRLIVSKVLKKTYNKKGNEHYIPKKDVGNSGIGNHFVDKQIINNHHRKSQLTGGFGPLVLESCPNKRTFGI